MTTKIDTDTTKHIADLIKIDILPEELPHYTDQLQTVINSVDVLSELDTADIPITAQTHGLTNVFRPDQVESGLDISQYPNRANLKNGYFVVDRVLN